MAVKHQQVFKVPASRLAENSLQLGQ